MEQITNILYWLSTGLMIPVTLLLVYFFVRAVVTIGTLYGEHLARLKTNKHINRELDTTEAAAFLLTLDEYKEKSALVSSLRRIAAAKGRQAMVDKIVGDHEIIADKQIGTSKLLVKIGPMLGLMGTLIPMGPALVGLATGDVASMASNMQVAFSTTVVGIIIGAIGFVSLQIKQRWAADDMNILEYIAASIKENK